MITRTITCRLLIMSTLAMAAVNAEAGLIFGTAYKKGVESFAYSKDSGNLVKQGALAVKTQVTVAGPAWVYCVNQGSEGMFSGVAGEDVKIIDPAVEFTSSLSFCSATGGNTCEFPSISNAVGIGLPSTLCQNTQNWTLVDVVPQKPLIKFTEYVCKSPAGATITCGADADTMLDSGVYLEEIDTLNMDCSFTDDVFYALEFGGREQYQCTEITY